MKVLHKKLSNLDDRIEKRAMDAPAGILSKTYILGILKELKEQHEATLMYASIRAFYTPPPLPPTHPFQTQPRFVSLPPVRCYNRLHIWR